MESSAIWAGTVQDGWRRRRSKRHWRSAPSMKRSNRACRWDLNRHSDEPAYFVASDFITNNELPTLLAAAEKEGAIVLPVILRPRAFRDTDLDQFHSVNAPSNPLSKMTRGKRDEVWSKVAELVRDALIKDS
jgi:hypothetical protein